MHLSVSIIVKNLIFDTYFMNASRSLRALRCLILFTAKSAKVAKINLKCLVFNNILTADKSWINADIRLKNQRLSEVPYIFLKIIINIKNYLR